MLKLVLITDLPNREVMDLMWQLLVERPPEACVSHQKMPTREEHEAFVRNHPYRAWMVILENDKPVGSIIATEGNEIGIAVLRAHQNRRIATRAITLLINSMSPLPALKSRRPAGWVANVSPLNSASHALFLGLGAEVIQVTYALPAHITERTAT